MAPAVVKRDKPSSRPRIEQKDVVDLCSSTASSDDEGHDLDAMNEDKKATNAGEGMLKRKVEAMSNGNGETKEYHSIYATTKSDGVKKERVEVVEEEEESENEEAESDADGDSHSLFDEQFDELGDDTLVDANRPIEYCSLEEARNYRRILREIGPREFIERMVYHEQVPVKKLMTAFGCTLPDWLLDAPDESAYPYLQWALIRELRRRAKIEVYNTVDDAVNLLMSSKNIIVLTGAGISTSLGIPDFRSTNGLYSLFKHRDDIDDPQEVFSLERFQEDPKIFFEAAKLIVPSLADHRYTPTHQFIKLLQDKNKLLTNYTQNIDNIESFAGVSPDKIVQCHGSFATATCTRCKAQIDGELIFPEMRRGEIPRCKACTAVLKDAPQPKKRRKNKRNSSANKKKKLDFEDSSEDEERYVIPEAGIMKPDITFFGEALPSTFQERLVVHDRDVVDLVVVMGTSMKVAPVSDVVDFLHNVPTIYISREPVKHIYFDIDLIGDCDVVVAELCRRAGWKMDHHMIPKDQVVEVKGDKNFPSRWYFKPKGGPPVKKDDVSEDEESVKHKIKEVADKKAEVKKEAEEEKKDKGKEKENGVKKEAGVVKDEKDSDDESL